MALPTARRCRRPTPALRGVQKPRRCSSRGWVFNFDPGALVKQRTAEDVRSDADVTKLCAPAAVSTRSTTPRAIRTPPRDGPLNPTAPDRSDPFRRVQHQLYQPREAAAGAGARHGDLNPGLYPRRHRLGNPEAGPKSPYGAVYGGMLGPPPSGLRPHGDGSRSPNADGLRSHGGSPQRSVLIRRVLVQ
ncbi:hypothetical protein CRUP_037088 [Coryphaenoides rupestris]|nr:hypothetical protein CRUP_037088 [Coryphaenoides rupestris]